MQAEAEVKKFYEVPNPFNSENPHLHRYSIAPMMDVTNIHYRTFIRLLTKKAVNYTEMVHCDTILKNPDTDRFLNSHIVEQPVVLQLGGCNPKNLAKASEIGETYGYTEINLNCGCPSPRVTSGSFGACLMKSPELVAECLRTMQEAVNVPVTVKCRLGVDDQDDYNFLKTYVETIEKNTDVKHIMIHARKAFLKGLNPKENRTVPPLIYDGVFQIAEDFPGIQFSINGGIKTLDKCNELLNKGNLIGCMVGRAAYEDIWHLSDVDRSIYGVANPGLSRKEVLLKYAEYADDMMAKNAKLNYSTLVKPLISLFVGKKGTTFFRRFLSDKKNFEKNEKSFAKLMEKFVIEFEQINAHALNEVSGNSIL